MKKTSVVSTSAPPVTGKEEKGKTLKSVKVVPIDPQMKENPTVGQPPTVQVFRVRDLMDRYGVKTGKQMRDYLRTLWREKKVVHHTQGEWSWTGEKEYQGMCQLLEESFPGLKKKYDSLQVTVPNQ